jgi:hypothetical protein
LVLPVSQIRFVRVQIRLPARTGVRRELQLELGCDRPGNLILHREQVFHLAVVPLGPQMRAVGGGDQLRRHADPLTRPAHAAFQHVGDAQNLRDSSNVDVLPFEGERRGARDHLQPGTFTSALMISSASPSLK